MSASEGIVALSRKLSVAAAAACAVAMGGALLAAGGGGPALGQMLTGRAPAPSTVTLSGVIQMFGAVGC